MLAPHCTTLAQAVFLALSRLLVTYLLAAVTAIAPRTNPAAPAARLLTGMFWPTAVRAPPAPAVTEVDAALPSGSKRLDRITSD